MPDHCLRCKKTDLAFCYDCFRKRGIPPFEFQRKEWQRLQRFVETIFKIYPEARIGGFFLNGKNSAVHFDLGIGGSDHVNVKWNGEVWQLISGDLNLNRLCQLEDELKKIAQSTPNLEALFRLVTKKVL